MTASQSTRGQDGLWIQGGMMVEALLSGAMCGAWLIGFFSVTFVGITAIAAMVRLGRWFSGEDKGKESA